MNSYFPMPFRRHARIELQSQHGGDLEHVFFQVDLTTGDDVADDVPYLHAQWRRSDGTTAAGEDHVILDGVRGRGWYAGTYVALVHGFETDQAVGGPGANYSLFTWSFGENDAAGNLSVVAPATVAPGDRRELAVTWNGLVPGLRHLGAIAHTTPNGLYSLTIVNVDSP